MLRAHACISTEDILLIPKFMFGAPGRDNLLPFFVLFVSFSELRERVVDKKRKQRFNPRRCLGLKQKAILP